MNYSPKEWQYGKVHDHEISSVKSKAHQFYVKHLRIAHECSSSLCLKKCAETNLEKSSRQSSQQDQTKKKNRDIYISYLKKKNFRILFSEMWLHRTHKASDYEFISLPDIINFIELNCLPLWISQYYEQTLGYEKSNLMGDDLDLQRYYLGLMHCRVPGVLRLLVRLNGLLYHETRLNLVLAKATETQPFDKVVQQSPTFRNTLRYHLGSLRTLWPFLFELIDISVTQLLYQLLRSRLCHQLLNLLTFEKLRVESSAQLLLDFIHFLADLLMSAHSLKAIKYIFRKPSNIPFSVFGYLCEYIKNKHIECILSKECLILIFDILYYSVEYDIPYETDELEKLRDSLHYFEMLEYPSSLVTPGCWISSLKFFHDALELFNWLLSGSQKSQTEKHERLKSFTTFSHYYLRASNADSIHRVAKPDILNRDAFPFNTKADVFMSTTRLKNILSKLQKTEDPGKGYRLPCWHQGCSVILSEWSLSLADQNFFYCPK